MSRELAEKNKTKQLKAIRSTPVPALVLCSSVYYHIVCKTSGKSNAPFYTSMKFKVLEQHKMKLNCCNLCM